MRVSGHDLVPTGPGGGEDDRIDDSFDLTVFQVPRRDYDLLGERDNGAPGTDVINADVYRIRIDYFADKVPGSLNKGDGDYYGDRCVRTKGLVIRNPAPPGFSLITSELVFMKIISLYFP